MKKTVRNICITFVVLGIICFVFWQIGWITSTKELCILFVIEAVVIPVDLFIEWIWKKLNKHQ